MSRRPARTVPEALRSGGLEGVRWVLSSPPSREALRRCLGKLAGAGEVISRLRVQSAAVNPGHRLRAGFEVAVSGPAEPSGATRAIFVVWLVKGAERPAAPTGPPLALPPGPFARFMGQDPESAMRVWVWPYDPSFAELARLADPAQAAGFLDQAPVRVRAVRYIPRWSHVLRYDVASGRAAHTRSFCAKLYQEAPLCALRSRVISAAAAAVAGAGTGADILAPVGRTEGAVLYPWISGGTLASALRRGRGGTGRILAPVGRTIHAVQQVPAPGELPLFTLEDELARTVHAARYLARLAPHASGRVARILELIADHGARVPAEPPALAHGDLKAEHLVMTRSGRPTVIDLDSCVRAEPAVDLGRLLGDIRWAGGRAGRGSGDQPVPTGGRDLLDGYASVAGLSEQRRERVRLFDLLGFVRAILRNLALWDAAWPERIDLLTTEALALAETLR